MKIQVIVLEKAGRIPVEFSTGEKNLFTFCLQNACSGNFSDPIIEMAVLTALSIKLQIQHNKSYFIFIEACDTSYQIFFFLIIRVQLFYDVVSVSAVQQSESALCIHITPLFLDFLPIQVTMEHCRVSCCYPVDPYQLSISYIVSTVYICQSQTQIYEQRDYGNIQFLNFTSLIKFDSMTKLILLPCKSAFRGKPDVGSQQQATQF